MSDLQEQFMHVTGVDADRAKFYLESAAGDLQVALSSFYEDDNDNNVEMLDLPSAADVSIIEQPARQPAGEIIDLEPSSTARRPLAGSTRNPNDSPPPEEDDDDDDEAADGERDRLSRGHNKKGGKPEYSKYGSIYGLPQANTSDDDNDDDEEKGQAFYAGGSERSGQQIIGPGKKSNDVVAGLFKAAKEHGAETVNDSGEPSKKSPSLAFRGTGHVLGTTEGDSEVVASTSDAAASQNEVREVILKMWRNGFSVDDGPLRDYSDPENREFLNCIRQGEIPQELIRLARGGEVSLDMEDHRQSDYERPKANLQAFAGAGHMLGSPAPNLINTSTASAAATGQRSGPSLVTVDEAQPVTNVQIRLTDGTRLTAKLNHTHTVGDLRLFITSERPQYASTVFALMTTFPNRELTDDQASLKEANLLNAVIVQKMQ